MIKTDKCEWMTEKLNKCWQRKVYHNHICQNCRNLSSFQNQGHIISLTFIWHLEMKCSLKVFQLLYTITKHSLVISLSHSPEQLIMSAATAFIMLSLTTMHQRNLSSPAHLFLRLKWLIWQDVILIFKTRWGNDRVSMCPILADNIIIFHDRQTSIKNEYSVTIYIKMAPMDPKNNSNCVSVWQATNCQDAAPMHVHLSKENDSSTMKVHYNCETEIKMSLSNIVLPSC